ncbi:hypothetical protein ACIBSW_29695 [Actinoplanes sp. NPDC049668]
MPRWHAENCASTSAPPRRRQDPLAAEEVVPRALDDLGPDGRFRT